MAFHPHATTLDSPSSHPIIFITPPLFSLSFSSPPLFFIFIVPISFFLLPNHITVPITVRGSSSLSRRSMGRPLEDRSPPNQAPSIDGDVVVHGGLQICPLQARWEIEGGGLEEQVRVCGDWRSTTWWFATDPVVAWVGSPDSFFPLFRRFLPPFPVFLLSICSFSSPLHFYTNFMP